jgi:hypothetical protein
MVYERYHHMISYADRSFTLEFRHVQQIVISFYSDCRILQFHDYLRDQSANQDILPSAGD